MKMGFQREVALISVARRNLQSLFSPNPLMEKPNEEMVHSKEPNLAEILALVSLNASKNPSMRCLSFAKT